MLERFFFPVAGAGLAIGSDELAEKLSPLPRDYKGAMVRRHGNFAVGQMMEEAFQRISSLLALRETLFLHRLPYPGEEKGEAEAC